MSLTNPNTPISQQDLQDFYHRILPYLGQVEAGFTPIGTIIAVFSETAPANYLACDGTTYNKSDYPELAAHLLALTTHSQYEVSGDATKFKVPDLRGEFLRMTGTNSHSGEGSGADVGVHQGGTQIPRMGIKTTQLMFKSNDYYTDVHEQVGADSTINSKSDGTIKNSIVTMTTSTTGVTTDMFTVRPTNTSVLFCIATKNIYLNPALDYSTDEKVVGHWIDGKTIYQKTIPVSSITLTTARGTRTTTTVDVSALNIDSVVKIDPIFSVSAGNVTNTINGCVLADSGTPSAGVSCIINNRINLNVQNSLWDTSITSASAIVTIQYTKSN